MKKITLTLLFVCFTCVLFAQTERGRFLISGDSKLAFYSVTDEFSTGSTTNEFEFSPQIGYFISNGVAIGIQVPIQYQKISEESSYDETHSVFFAPFIRSYMGKSRLKPYFEGSVGLGVSKSESSYESESSSENQYMINLGAGLAYWMTKNVSFETGLKFIYLSYGSSGSSNNVSKGFGFNMGFAISI